MHNQSLEKLHKDAVFVTVFIMFLLLAWIIPNYLAPDPGQPSISAQPSTSSTSPQQGENPAEWTTWILAAVVASFGSRSIYTVIAGQLAAWGRSQMWLKRRYLGREFMHGTWYGLLRTKRDHLRIYVEQFDQKLDGLTIRGASFRLPDTKFASELKECPELFRQDATWVTRATRINPHAGDLYCFYENNVVRKHYPVLAIGHFNLDYDASNVPVEVRGYAIDVDAGIERSLEATTTGCAEEVGRVRLSYERMKKAARGGVFQSWPLRAFADQILTTEEAKARALEEFEDVIKSELDAAAMPQDA